MKTIALKMEHGQLFWTEEWTFKKVKKMIPIQQPQLLKLCIDKKNRQANKS